MKSLLLALVLALPATAQVVCPTATPPPPCVTATPTPATGTPTPTPTPTFTPTPAPAVGYCVPTGPAVTFEPLPPGAPRPQTLSSGFSSSLYLFGNRLMMSEAFGYSILDLSNPTNPTALIYHDTRYPLGGAHSLAGRGFGYGGDGQSDVA